MTIRKTIFKTVALSLSPEKDTERVNVRTRVCVSDGSIGDVRIQSDRLEHEQSIAMLLYSLLK